MLVNIRDRAGGDHVGVARREDASVGQRGFTRSDHVFHDIHNARRARRVYQTHAHTVATVASPSSTAESVTAAATSHIYTGKPTTFGTAIPPTGGSGSTSTSGGAGKEGSTPPTTNQQAALAALGGALKAAPQYLVLPSSSVKSGPDDFEGPGGGDAPCGRLPGRTVSTM